MPEIDQSVLIGAVALIVVLAIALLFMITNKSSKSEPLSSKSIDSSSKEVNNKKNKQN